jgi:hypothetical protein
MYTISENGTARKLVLMSFSILLVSLKLGEAELILNLTDKALKGGLSNLGWSNDFYVLVYECLIDSLIQS